MDFFNDLFWNISFDGDYLGLLVDVLAFIGIWLALFYLLYFLLAKIVRSKLHKDIQLRLNFLWALAGLQFLIIVYLFFLFRYDGTEVLRWRDTNFYLAFAPQLLLFFGAIVLFVVRAQDYRRKLQV